MASVKTRFPDYRGWLPPDPRVRNKFMKDVRASISSHPKNISTQRLSVVSKFSGLQIADMPPVGLIHGLQIVAAPPVDPPVDPPPVDPPPVDDDVGPALVPEHAAVVHFQLAVEADPHMLYLFQEVFQQAGPLNLVPDFETFLAILAFLIEHPPPYIQGEDANGPFDGPIGVPFYWFFDLLSNTFAALELFLMPAFNNALRTLLNVWGNFLQTPASTASLNQTPDGWFGDIGILRLTQPLCTNRAPDTADTHENAFGNAPPGLNILQFSRAKFVETFEVPDANLQNYGFLSWDAFFTRKFNAGVRPVVPPNPLVGVPIYSPCESAIFRIAPNVRWNDKFWIKETQPYSVRNMLIPETLANNNGYTDFVRVFENGTVYQAFLSPYNYHRWHSPIDGTIVKIVKIPGSYYAVLPDNAAEAHGAIIRSQAFLTISATRLLIYIRSTQDPNLMICFMAVGMVEVSTCELTLNNDGEVIPGVAVVNENNFANVDVDIVVAAGQELGMFHFGGSSSVILVSGGFNFQPTVGVVQPGDGEPPNHIWLSTHIGNVVPA